MSDYPLLSYYWPVRLPPGTGSRLLIPQSRLRSCGPPRFLDRSIHARCPLSPRAARRLLVPVASSPVPGFIIFGRLATAILCNEVDSGSLLQLRLVCSPYKVSPAELLPPTLARLLVERAIDKISSFQNIRSARLILALRTTRKLRKYPDSSFVCFVPFVVKSLVVICLWLRLCRAGFFVV